MNNHYNKQLKPFARINRNNSTKAEIRISHQFKYNEDIRRDEILKELGFSVLRFTDDEIKNHITNVERAIIQWIEENKK